MSNDLTSRQPGDHALNGSTDLADSIMATLREPLLVLDRGLRVKTANRSFIESFHVSNEEVQNRLVYDLGEGEWDIPPLRTLLNEVLFNSDPIHDVKVDHQFPDIGERSCCSTPTSSARHPTPRR